MIPVLKFLLANTNRPNPIKTIHICSFKTSRKSIVKENKAHLFLSMKIKLKIINGGAKDEGENSKSLLLTAGL